VARACDTQAGVALEALIVTWRPWREGKIGELVHQHLWCSRFHRARERFDIEHIDHHRLRAELGKRGRLVLRPRSTDNRMPGPAQQWCQPAANGAARSGEKYLHSNSRNVW